MPKIQLIIVLVIIWGFIQLCCAQDYQINPWDLDPDVAAITSKVPNVPNGKHEVLVAIKQNLLREAEMLSAWINQVDERLAYYENDLKEKLALEVPSKDEEQFLAYCADRKAIIELIKLQKRHRDAAITMLAELCESIDQLPDDD